MIRKSTILPLLLAAVALWNCSENIDITARYVFQHKTLTEYLDSHEEYSDYMRLLSKVPVSRISKTTLRQLLSARGHYTVFAPTNEAIQNYLDTLSKRGIISEPSWEGFPNGHVLDSIEKVIVYNSIIDSGDQDALLTYNFPSRQDAEIPFPNMYDRRLVVHVPQDSVGPILVNDAPLDERNCDIPLLNGVLHAVHAVIAPSNNTLGRLLFNTYNQRREGFYVASMLAKACGLIDTLEKYKDFAYEEKYISGIVPEYREHDTGQKIYWSPENRYYGYTYFAETDSFWQSELGKNPLDIQPADVAEYLTSKGIYPDAQNNTDYESTDNLLNRFVTYHLLPLRLSTDNLVHHGNEKGYNKDTKELGTVMSEFYTTMGHRRLLKILESKESHGIYLNRFPKIDNSRHGDYHELGCEADKEGILIGAPNLEGENNVRNGIIYPIDKLLVYDDPTRNNLMRQRIRWDVTAMFPELTNNDIRMSAQNKHCWVDFPPNTVYKYLDDLDISEETVFFYEHYGYGNNYLLDEFRGTKRLDITLRMPPVPRRGTYELRIAVKYGTDERRGIYQFYWGTDKEHLAALGIPVNYSVTGREIGWEEDSGDDDYDAEVDKRLRNKDWMKGPNLYPDGRDWQGALRRIIVRRTMDPDETYYLRFKCVTDRYGLFLYFDYMEYCAKEVYDSPETPEDIW